MLVQELDELTLGSTRLVGDWSLGSFREELDSWETPDVVFGSNGLVVGLIGVHMSDDTIGFGSECSSNVLVCRLHILLVSNYSSSFTFPNILCSVHTVLSARSIGGMSVTYPWSSESDKDIFVVVQNDIVKVTGCDLDSSRRSRRLDLGFGTGFLGNAFMSAPALGHSGTN